MGWGGDLGGGVDLLHPVEGGAGLEPLDLAGVEGVVEHDLVHAAVSVLQVALHLLEEKGEKTILPQYSEHE